MAKNTLPKLPPGGYHVTIDNQKYDRKAIQTAKNLHEGRGDGRLSKADAEKVADKLPGDGWNPGKGLTAIEEKTADYIREHANFTGAGRRVFDAEVPVRTPAAPVSPAQGQVGQVGSAPVGQLSSDS